MHPTKFAAMTALALVCRVSALAQDGTISLTPDQLKWETTRQLVA